MGSITRSTDRVARRGFEPLTSSLKAMRPREAAQQILRARIETGFERKRTSEKRPRSKRGGQQAATTTRTGLSPRASLDRTG